MPTQKTQVGYAGGVKEIEVTLPDGEPAPWGADAQLKYVGKNTQRIDAVAKVTGRAKYTYDVNLHGMLTAKILIAPYGAGTLTKLDMSKAAKMPGVKAVLPYMEVGKPILHHGVEIAAVAAETEEQAEEAVAAIEYAIEKLPAVTTIEQAMRPGAQRVFPDRDNVQTTGAKDEGPKGEEHQQGKDRKSEGETNTRSAIAKARHKVKATYTTEVQNHNSLETHGVVASFTKDGAVTVWASTQGTFGVKGSVVEHLKLPDDKVRVLTEYMGGGFGSKFRLEVAGIIAIDMAKKTKRPVKCMLTREAEHLRGGNRPSSKQAMEGGVGSDGKVLGVFVETWGSAGVATGAGAKNPAIYELGTTHKIEHTVFTNAAPARAFRAPGHPQGIFALESFMDEMAHAARMDPIKFREKNIDHPFYKAQWAMGAKEIDWDNKRNKVPGQGRGPIKRGVGMASTLWYQMGGPGSEVDVTVGKDGRVVIENGAQDVGTGTKTVLAVIVGEELSLPPGRLLVKMGDTRLPIGPGSGGSQTAASVGPAARNAGIAMRNALLGLVAKKWGVAADTLTMESGQIRAGTQNMSFADACKLIPGADLKVRGARAKNYEAYHKLVGGCQFAEVEVDTETGVIRVLKVAAVQDAGRVINKLLFESQICGGVIQGLSFALHEERILDHRFGTQVNADFIDYKIAGPEDIPEIVPIAFDVANAGNNCGMMGLGEPPKVPTAAAIANAVFNATGVRVRSLPMTPNRVLAALEAARGGKK